MTKALQTQDAANGGEVPAALIKLALDKEADVAKLEKLLELQERWEATQARKAFFDALAAFQSEAPQITKDAVVDFQPRGKSRVFYRHATLPHIINTLRVPLKEHGFAYRFETSDGQGSIKVACIITHTGGHSERTEMSAPSDTSGSKNDIQARGSTVSYLQRYTLLGALGLVAADEDDDGRKGRKPETAPSDKFAQLVNLWVDESEGPGSPLYGYKCSATETDILRAALKQWCKGRMPQTAEAAIAWLKENAVVVVNETDSGEVDGVRFERKDGDVEEQDLGL